MAFGKTLVKSSELMGMNDKAEYYAQRAEKSSVLIFISGMKMPEFTEITI